MRMVGKFVSCAPQKWLLNVTRDCQLPDPNPFIDTGGILTTCHGVATNATNTEAGKKSSVQTGGCPKNGHVHFNEGTGKSSILIRFVPFKTNHFAVPPWKPPPWLAQKTSIFPGLQWHLDSGHTAGEPHQHTILRLER